MRLTFLGAARMVTGSCYLLEAGGLRLLVDCGMFQGGDEDLNREPFPFFPGELDGVILTHAHIDHSGRLPLLRKQGFRGPIHTHGATADLATIMLLDSAFIQEAEADRSNRKASRAGQPLQAPLYSQEDARSVAELFRPVSYGEMLELNDRLRIRLQDAGHILGSAVVEVFESNESGQETKLVFSGDLGQPGRPILRDPTVIEEADYLVVESTYGNRRHETPESTREALGQIIRSTIAKGGNLVIPAFAVGRTQELLYELNGLRNAGQLPKNLRMILDSPLAIAATEITTKHHEVFDDAATRLVRNGDDPFHFPGLAMCHTAQESMALNNTTQPMVILAASGMCEAGRIVHHLKHNLWREVATVLFCGFQAEGTLGRRIADGAKRVKIHGEEVAVRCRVESLHGFSAHADQAQLLEWVGGLKRPPVTTILVHGESEAQEEFGALLEERGHQVIIPMMGQSLEIQPVTAAGGRAARVRKARAAANKPAKVALAEGAALALSARRMSALLRELRDLRKVWFAQGPHLSSDQAAELADRADEVMRNLEAMRRLMN